MLAESEKRKLLEEQLTECSLCGNHCGIDRRADGAVPACGAGPVAEIARSFIDHNREPPISGRRGSGSVVFQYCGLACVYCSNWEHVGTSKTPTRKVNPGALADELFGLRSAGVHTLSLVAATSHLATVVPALEQVRSSGLDLPIVYISAGYESFDSLRLLDGLVDVYVPEMKYGTDEVARVYSGVVGYVAANRAAVKEMLRQVGGLKVGPDGIARRGILLRHQVLPAGMADTVQVLEWAAYNLPPDAAISLVGGYCPSYQVAAGLFPEINRKVTRQEYEFTPAVAAELGLRNIYTDVDGRRVHP